jgi:hypothetical protein
MPKRVFDSSLDKQNKRIERDGLKAAPHSQRYACGDMKDWKFHKVVYDGDRLKITNVNVWEHKWISSDSDTIEVPHPQYPSQRHTLWPYYIEIEGKRIHFAAGELSNCVWCFYLPK